VINHNLATTILAVLLAGWMSSAAAQDRLERVEGDDEVEGQTFVWLPYFFYTENFKLALGVGAGSHGYGQPQLGLAATAFGTTNGSWGVLGTVNNFQIGPESRFFMDANAGYIRYQKRNTYVDGNPDFVGETAGSNDSSKENFVESPARDGFTNFKFRYLIPVGFGRDTVINTFVVQDGILVSGSTGGWTWNPTISGRTYLDIDLFYETQTLNLDDEDQKARTNGITLQLEYDNTDFWLNPSRGSRQSLGLTRDFGWANSSGAWTTGELDLSDFVELGSGRYVRQAVIALNLWTAYTFSGTPPYYKAPRLGGLYRLRGYRSNRFHDQSAIYYGAELRVIPSWSPLNAIDHIGPIVFNWWQLVAFAEIGRVSPVYSLKELHSDMKWDVGVGVRTLVKSVVVRADLGFSPEGAQLSAMAGHSF